jgi:CheY-like chemotaxis protein
VLDISRIESGTLSLSLDAVPLDAVITDTLELIRPLADSSRVDLYGPPTAERPRYVRGDYQRLRQVLINLLSNAVKYNRPDGIAAVRVGSIGDGRVRIEVTDTGPGIAAGDIRRLFTPFERLGAAQSGVEGTGLGLALSRQLTEAMGGTIGVSSYLGAGSTFWIQLAEAEPAAITETGRREARRVEVRQSGRPRRVLYVEDMVHNIRLVEEILKRRPDVTLVPAMLGSTGLTLAREPGIDLALLELHLPDMSGMDVMHHLHDDPATQHIPVVILSADATRRQIDALLDAGASAYLTKPFDVARFLEVVDQQLDDSMVGARPAAEDPGCR